MLALIENDRPPKTRPDDRQGLVPAVAGDKGGGRRSFSVGVSRWHLGGRPARRLRPGPPRRRGRPTGPRPRLDHLLRRARRTPADRAGARSRRAAAPSPTTCSGPGRQHHRGDGPAGDAAGPARHQLQRGRGGPRAVLPLQHDALPRRQARAAARPGRPPTRTCGSTSPSRSGSSRSPRIRRTTRPCEASTVRVRPPADLDRGARRRSPATRTRRCWPAGRACPAAVDAARRAVPAGRHQRAARSRRASRSTTDGVRVGRPGPARRRPGLRGRTPRAAAAARWRWPTSRTPRSATGAPPSARSCTPTPPPRCRWCSAAGRLGGRRGPARGRRTIAADDLFVGPAGVVAAATTRSRSSAFFPALAAGSGVAFEEVARRHGDYALCGVAALVEADDDGRRGAAATSP